MKKTFSILILLSSLAQSEVYYKNKSSNNYSNSNSSKNQKNSINFKGEVLNIRDFRDYYAYTIKDESIGIITIQYHNKPIKIGDIARGGCYDKKYSDYVNCNIIY